MEKRMGLFVTIVILLLITAFSVVWGDRGLAVVKRETPKISDSFLPYRSAAPFPNRPDGALGGREFLKGLASLPPRRREAAILSELIRGNVPDHLRTLQPVKLSMRDSYGRVTTGTIWVTSDYMAVGGNRDFVRVPMSLESASRLAIRLGMGLPTAKVVDQVYKSAQIKLTPDPMPPRDEMTSIAYAIKHDDRIARRISAILPIGLGQGDLLFAGHKKDLVITRRLEQNIDRVAIFGWHRAIGRPIQALNTSHGRLYADYSHGVRLVSVTLYVDGRFMPIEEALNSYTYAPMLSDEGRLPHYASLMEIVAGGGSKSSFEKLPLFAEVSRQPLGK